MIVRLIFVLALAVSASLVPVSRAKESPGSSVWSVIGVEQTRPCGSLGGLAADRGGRTLMLWSDCAGSSGSAITALATRAAGGGFRRTGELSGVVTALARQGDGAMLAALTNVSNRGLRAADVSTTGRVVRVTQLTRRFVRWVDVAADDRGNAMVAWVTSAVPQRLQVRIRTRGHHTFGPALTLVELGADVGGLSVAIGPRGKLAVLWASQRSGRRSVLARLRPAEASAFEPPIPAGGNDRLAVIDSAFTATGSLVAIWRTTDAGEQQDRPAVVRVATLPNGSRRFIGQRTLGTGVDNDHWFYGHAVRATSAGRTAVVAWTDVKHAVHLMHVTPAGLISQPQTPDTDGLLGDLVATVSGTILVSWGHHPYAGSADGQLVAAVQLPGGRLGAPQPVGPPGTQPAGAAIDAPGTRAVIASTAYDSAGSTITIYQQQIR